MKSPSDYHYCGKKRRYISESHALMIGRHVNMDNAYRCPKCRYWHLTSKPKAIPCSGVIELFDLSEKPLGIS